MSSPVTRTLVVWLLLMAVESAHGVLRTLLLVPIVGDIAARQIGVVIGSILILLVALATVHWIGLVSVRDLLLVGLSWVALTIPFGIGLGRFFGYSWDRIVSDYDPAAGGFLGFGMIALLVAPVLAARLRAPVRQE